MTEFAKREERGRNGDHSDGGMGAGHDAIEGRKIRGAAEVRGGVRVGGNESGGCTEDRGHRNPRSSVAEMDGRGPDLTLIGDDVREHRGKRYGSLVLLG